MANQTSKTESVKIRRAPKFLPFLLTGGILGIIVALIVGLAIPAEQRTAQPIITYLLAYFAGIGVAEDRDWGRRALARGYETRYAPDMIVYHPARTHIDDMAAKWRRQTAHDLADHQQSGRSDLIWLARLAAMLGITPFHALRLLCSPRVHGLGARLRGVACLAQIRRLRAQEMWHQWADPAHEGASGWNRDG